MALALYRKYRPQTFGEIVGQEHIRQTLAGEVATGRIVHAYLFSGPRGTGKTSAARILAKAVNCAGRTTGQQDNRTAGGEPCNKCEPCQAITAGRALDVIEIDAATHTQVDNVREVIVETARFMPSALRYKLFIIDEAHMLSNGAWSALLKIIEEPPRHLLFIFATTELQKVPNTILSRCQRFDFRRVSANDLTALLADIARREDVKIEERVLRNIARLSDGCVRDAEGMLEQLCSLGEKTVDQDIADLVLPRVSFSDALEFIGDTFAKDAAAALKRIDDLVNAGAELRYFTEEVLGILRNLLILSAVGDSRLRGQFDETGLRRLAEISKAAELPGILRAIEAFSRAYAEIKHAHIPQLPLEVAVAELCRGHEHAAKGAQKIDAVKSNARRPETEVAASPRQNPIAARSADSAAGASFNAANLTEIKAKWPEILKRAQNANHSLSFLLSTSEPLALNKDVLQIGMRYPFHRDKLNEARSREALEGIIAEILNARVRVQGILNAAREAPPQALDEVVNILGGQMVESA